MDRTLTGRWIGHYDYADGAPSVPFEADLTQTGMTLRATTVEPNTFRPGGMPELRGFLTGWIVGSEVRLTKTYTFDQGADPEYVGRVDPSFRRITGRWNFDEFPEIRGNFSMMRQPDARAKVARRAIAEAEI
ncbi:MAG: hypothetical protein WBA67_07860 [Jannaschia sp.]